jgi:hypothetical protein
MKSIHSIKKIVLELWTYGITILMILVGSIQSIAQQVCKPGGINSSSIGMRFWLESLDMNADNRVSAQPNNNANVIFWKDKSGNNINFSQGIQNKQPRYVSTFSEFPAVQFYDTVGSIKQTLNPVINQANLLKGSVYFVYYGRTFAGMYDNILMEDKRANGDGSLRYVQWGTAGNPKLGFTLYNIADYISTLSSPINEKAIISYNKAAADANVRIRVKNDISSVSIANSNTAIPIGSLGTNTNTTNDFANGYYYEVIVFDTFLNNTQQTIIENHLAAKYSGVTGDILPTPNTKYTGANASAGNFDYDVIGIGRTSSSDNSYSAINSFGFNINATIANDNNYLMLGHNDANRTAGKSWIASGLLETERFDRVWRYTHSIVATNLINFEFDFLNAKSNVTPTGSNCNYYLLHSTNGSTWTILAIASSIVGNKLHFNNVSLALVGTEGYLTVGHNTTSASITLSSNQNVICGTTTNFILTTTTNGLPTNASYTWYNSTDNGNSWNVINGALLSNLAVNASFITNTLYRVKASPVIGCDYFSNAITVTVNSNLNNGIGIANNGNTTICSGSVRDSLISNGTNSTGTYLWEYQEDNSSVWINTGITTEKYLPPIINNNNNNNITVKYRRKLTQNGCVKYSNEINITIKPIVAKQGPIQGNEDVCIPKNGENYLIANTPGATYTWIYSGTGATIQSGATTNSILVQYSNTATNGSWTVTMTLNGCTSTPSDPMPVVLNPTPTLAALTDKTTCDYTTLNSINFSSSLPGTTYNWTNSNTTIGLTASGTGGLPSFLALNTTAVNNIATITVTPKTDKCTGRPTLFTITVLPSPLGIISANHSICSGTPVNLSYTSSKGAAPFILTINGTDYSGVQSGSAVNVGSPTSSTIYNLTKIKDNNNCYNR